MYGKLSAVGLVGVLLMEVWVHCANAADSIEDYLIPIPPAEGASAAYKVLYEKKLFVTRADVARYLFLPALQGREGSAAIYRASHKKGGLPGDYWLTTTISSANLWDCVSGSCNSDTIKIRRWDVPLQEKMAQAIQRVWVLALKNTKTPSAPVLRIDSSRQIFSAADSTGIQMRAETFEFGRNNRRLILLGEALLEFCALSPNERLAARQNIERDASSLARDLSRTKRPKQ